MPTPSPAPVSAPAPIAPAIPAAAIGRVAVVCRAGDEAAKTLAAFLKELGLDTVTGGAGASPNPDTLEKLRNVEFAILMRSDRPLETGFLLGVLGARRMCLLLPPQASAPGLDSLDRVPLDAGGVWRLLLARELKQGGLEIDLNKAL